MKEHKKKLIAPILVTIIMILYYVVYFGFLIALIDGVWKWLLGIIPLVDTVICLAPISIPLPLLIIFINLITLS